MRGNIVNEAGCSIIIASLIFDPSLHPGSARHTSAQVTEGDAIRILSALGQTTRLRVVLALVGAGGAGMASSDIADVIGVPRNLMSSHLAILSKAGAVVSLKQGRAVTYTVRGEAIGDIANYLLRLAAASSREKV